MPTSEVLCSPWAVVADIDPDVRTTLDLTDPELQALLLTASETLWALSGRVWYGGGCTETVTLRSWPPPAGTDSWPYHSSWGRCGCWAFGSWVDGRFCPSPGWSGRHAVAPIAVKLPRSPVTAITSVEINGDPFTAYRLVRAGWLERTDGQPWQACDDATEITYTFGEPPPSGGQRAAIELGVELAKDQLGMDDCRLPVRTVSVTRQGISMSMVDPFDFLEKGKTGLPGVDLWLSAVNPQASPQASTVWSPDLPTTVRS